MGAYRPTTILVAAAAAAGLTLASPSGPASAQEEPARAQEDAPAAPAPDTVVRRLRGHPTILGAYLPPGEEARRWTADAMEEAWLHYHLWPYGPRPGHPSLWLTGEIPEVPGLFPRADCRRGPRDEADYLIPLLALPLHCAFPGFRPRPRVHGVRGPPGAKVRAPAPARPEGTTRPDTAGGGGL